MWKMWKKLKRKTKIKICEGAAIASVIGFFCSASAIENVDTLAPFWCALAFLGSLWFFGYMAGWIE